jgi:hypothetical protein
MLKILSDLTQVERIDFSTGVGTLIASGYQGQWLVPGATYATFPTSGQAGVFQIWTEGNRDGTVGFTPDTVNTEKLTTLYGKYRARTDKFDGVIGDYAIGTKLTVSTLGNFAPVTNTAVSGVFEVTADHVCAVCIGVGEMTHFTHNSGALFDYIEFVTV